MGLVLLNKYLKVLIKFLEPKIFNEKVEVIIDYFILKNNTLAFLLNITSFRYCMMTSKYLIDRAKFKF